MYKINRYPECQLVTVDDKCKINNNGYCDEKDDKYDKCSFTIFKRKNMSKVEGSDKCKEVTIKTQCLIVSDGKCVVHDEYKADNKVFSFDFYKDICQLYEKDNECEIDRTTGECNDKSDATVSNKYCAFDTTNTKCKLRDVTECKNYGIFQSRCEADTK